MLEEFLKVNKSLLEGLVIPIPTTPLFITFKSPLIEILAFIKLAFSDVCKNIGLIIIALWYNPVLSVKLKNIVPPAEFGTNGFLLLFVAIELSRIKWVPYLEILLILL